MQKAPLKVVLPALSVLTIILLAFLLGSPGAARADQAELPSEPAPSAELENEDILSTAATDLEAITELQPIPEPELMSDNPCTTSNFYYYCPHLGFCNPEGWICAYRCSVATGDCCESDPDCIPPNTLCFQ